MPISEGVTTLKYMSPWKDVLTFGHNSNVVIYSKSAGSDESLWGVAIKGKRGYAPKSLIRETRVLFRGDLQYEVSTSEEAVQPPPPPPPQVENVEQPASIEELPTPVVAAEIPPAEEFKEEAIESPPPTPYTIPEQELPQGDDPKVTLETIPNNSGQEVPSPPSEPEKVEEVPTLAPDAIVPVEVEEKPAEQEPQEEAQKEDPKLPVETIETKEAVVENLSKEQPATVETDNDDYLDDEDDEEDFEGEEEDEEEEEDDVGAEKKDEASPTPNEQQEQKPIESQEPVTEEILLPPVVDSPPPTEPAVPTIEEPVVLNEIPPPADSIPVAENVDIPSTNDVASEKQKEETDQPTPIESPNEVDSDLPTPPSSLLGDFINMNTQAPPSPTASDSMMFQEHPEATVDARVHGEQVENVTGQLNESEDKEKLSSEGTEAVKTEPENVIPQGQPPVVPETQQFDPLPPVENQLPIEVEKVEIPPVEPLVEQRIPPIVQQQLNNDFYNYQNPPQPPQQAEEPPANVPVEQPPVESNNYPGNVVEENRDSVVEPAVPVADRPAYAQPPELPTRDYHYHSHGHDHHHHDHHHGHNHQHDHHGHDHHHGHHEEPYHHGTVDQFVPPVTTDPSIAEEVPPPPMAQEDTTAMPLPSHYEEAPVQSEEPVESGPGLLDNVIDKAKGILGSMDISSLFKSSEQPTEPGSVIVGDHVEGGEEEEVQEGE